MLKQVLGIAWERKTEIDEVILWIGVLSLILILVLEAIKIFVKKPFPKRCLRACLWLSSIYQWGIDACPLLGTLGTVVALIYSAGNPAELEGSFLFALTSTFWGIVMALLCKLIESITQLDGYFEMFEEEEQDEREKKEQTEHCEKNH